MNYKKVNWMFLSILLFEIIVLFALAVLQDKVATNLAGDLVLSELILMLPMLVFLLLTRTRFREVFAFKKIKIATGFMTVLFVYLTMPAVTTINAISMIFSDNVVANMSQDILDLPFLLMLFLMGIFGPVCEELLFRGAIYNGYRNSAANPLSFLQACEISGIRSSIRCASSCAATSRSLARLVRTSSSLGRKKPRRFLPFTRPS